VATYYIAGLQDASDATIETLKAIDHPISKTAQILVEACSFAGTGNVLKIQAMLHHCDDHITASKKDSKEEKKDAKDAKDAKEESIPDATFSSFAVIAIALIAMGEDIGAEMSLRQFNHLVSNCNTFLSCHCVYFGVFLNKDALWRTHNSKSCSARYWPC
jgi:26S proteasome regulatory subunit N1